MCHRVKFEPGRSAHKNHEISFAPFLRCIVASAQDLSMDLKTSFAFYFVSLALYLVVLSSMALADKRVIGARWLAYSVLVEMIKIGLQAMSGSIPRLISTMVANELNLAAFFTMYMGFRWFVQRER